MTRYEKMSQEIDANISRLKTMTPGEHGFIALSTKTADMILARGELTIGEASEEVE